MLVYVAICINIFDVLRETTMSKFVFKVFWEMDRSLYIGICRLRQHNILLRTILVNLRYIELQLLNVYKFKYHQILRGEYFRARRVDIL